MAGAFPPFALRQEIFEVTLLFPSFMTDDLDDVKVYFQVEKSSVPLPVTPGITFLYGLISFIRTPTVHLISGLSEDVPVIVRVLVPSDNFCPLLGEVIFTVGVAVWALAAAIDTIEKIINPKLNINMNFSSFN